MPSRMVECSLRAPKPRGWSLRQIYRDIRRHRQEEVTRERRAKKVLACRETGKIKIADGEIIREQDHTGTIIITNKRIMRITPYPIPKPPRPPPRPNKMKRKMRELRRGKPKAEGTKSRPRAEGEEEPKRRKRYKISKAKNERRMREKFDEFWEKRWREKEERRAREGKERRNE